MKLESARALKQALLSDELGPLLKKPHTVTGFALAAEALTPARRVQPTIALGIARRSKNDYRLAVRIQDRAFEATAHVERIRKRAKNEVDVRYVGWIDKQAAPWQQQRQRPLLIGCSIGHFRITAGTLGCFVQSETKKACVLSNNHVLADENSGALGDAVLQPGKYDLGTQKDRVAGLSAFVALRVQGINYVDAARAEFDTGVAYDAAQLRGLGTLKGVGSGLLSVGASVAKIGRTTGLTRGRVTAFDLDNVVVGYGIGTLRFDDQVEIEGAEQEPFSRGGDSGSLIVDADQLGVALLFAGSDQGGSNGAGLTYANPLPTVLSELGVTLLT